jgi:hypothetical protein
MLSGLQRKARANFVNDKKIPLGFQPNSREDWMEDFSDRFTIAGSPTDINHQEFYDYLKHRTYRDSK